MKCTFRRAIPAVMAAVLLWTGLRPALGDRFQNPKVKPPQAKPQRRSAAEGIPPLPLPATPLRRSERKRQPAPPALVGMIHFTDTQFQMVQGQRRRVELFPTTQVDIEKLMRYANHRLKIKYRYVATTLEKFSWDPAEMPLLYLTGWTEMPRFSDSMIKKLRRYLYDGGTLVLHAQCGRPEFQKSALQIIADTFPKNSDDYRRLVTLDTDSAIYHSFFDLNRKMRVREGKKPVAVLEKPVLQGVYLGCRPAIIYSPIDLNCSWDVEKNPIEGGLLYHQDDGLMLGVNIIAATLANFQYAKSFGTQKLYPEADKNTRDQLVVAQIRHGGDWDPTPHALPNLLKYVQKNTTLNVKFEREVVDLDSVDVFKQPLLYMTGLRDFKLSDQQVKRLRAYLASGGVLIADAAAGRAAFDKAFRRELKRVLPEHKLEQIGQDSALLEMPYKIKAVDYTPLVKAQQKDLNTPQLLGVTLDGQLGVIYSPLSLSNGWEQLGFPYNRGYSDEDAIRLGVNLFAYALTH
ncbi:MAG: DUF4159 domain-containing protein [Phycisphaerae bacterium]